MTTTLWPRNSEYVPFGPGQPVLIIPPLALTHFHIMGWQQAPQLSRPCQG